jgi:CBS-domain-containing membrane protein
MKRRGLTMRRRGLTAKDIMQRRVVTADPEMTAQAAMELFLDRQITGAPVVDEIGTLVGVVSQSDLLRHQRQGAPAIPQAPSYYYETDGQALVSRWRAEAPKGATVQELMTPAAFMTDEHTPLDKIARFMLKHRVHRVIITRQGKLAGIVTSMDLLRALLDTRGPHRSRARRTGRAGARKSRTA